MKTNHQRTLDGTPVSVKNDDAARRSEISQPDRPRDPAVIAGHIRTRVEWLLKRNSGIAENECANYQDAMHIDAYIDELLASLLENQLRSSIGRKP